MNWDNFNHHYIPAKNISSGFHAIELAMMEEYGIGEKCMLTAEPMEVIPVFQARFPDTKFFTLGYDGIAACIFEKDLNVLFDYGDQFDTILSQATLEHVCRPSIMIENLVNMCKPGGHIVLHTVGPECPLHRIPIDCVRFLRDFYIDLQKYLPIKLVAFCEKGMHQFITYQKKGDKK